MSDFLTLRDNGKLRLEYHVEGTVLKLRPVGSIDEDVNFSVILDLLSEIGKSIKMIQFDLGLVTGLNSCGVREWLLFMERVSSIASCAFINVTEIFIDQANMIANLFGKGASPILSFQAPYHCSQCNSEAVMLLDPTQIQFKEEQPIPPPFKCPKCSSPMEFDSLEEEYFNFIVRLRHDALANG